MEFYNYGFLDYCWCNKSFKFSVFWGNGILIKEVINYLVSLLFKSVISGQDVIPSC